MYDKIEVAENGDPVRKDYKKKVGRRVFLLILGIAIGMLCVIYLL